MRWLLLIFLVGTTGTALAQTPSTDSGGDRLGKGAVEAGVIAGTTLPVTWLRAHSDRHVTLASLEVGRILTHQIGHGPLSGSFEMLLSVTPLFIIQQPARTEGLAATPVHFRWNFAPLHANGPRVFAEASGGVLFTGAEVPPRTTRFNFIDQAGFGVRFPGGANRMWLAGYRFQHISNGGRVKPNPGVNFNFVYAGFSLTL